ncbi:MAG: DNA repair protein RadA [Spirochaetaceae bacterium]|nr:DNA repair protein RadA [Spirochaetaceae bacterium]
MPKAKSVFICKECGHNQPQWTGRCSGCGEWNSLAEESVSKTAETASSSFFKGKGQLTPLAAIKTDNFRRYSSGFSEADQVLGGGIVQGGATLIGGEPGIGKSTLMLQVANHFANGKFGKVLYVSGEESPAQIKMRADRLKVSGHIEIYSATDLEAVLKAITNIKPALVIVDSAQTLYSNEAGLIPGTTSQIRRCCHELIGICKDYNTACFIVAHVTKEGAIAGPKAIEHLVDTVTYFEQGDNDLRLLRAVKNRFGAVDELGLFTMHEDGLHEANLKDAAISFKHELPAGSAIAASFEGSRVFLHEIQALTVTGKGGNARVYSERIDNARVQRIAAVLERHAGIRFSDQDIYVNVSGGIKLTETGVDLPLALALYSARLGLTLPVGLASAGELALSGNVREASHKTRRAKTAGDLGFTFLSPGRKDKTAGFVNEQHISAILKQVAQNS